MHTDQARKLVTLHDNADRALANLRNANSMSTDDPRATELLEDAGDAYAETLTALRRAQETILNPLRVVEDVGEALAVDYPEGYEPGKAAWIVGGDVEDGNVGAGVIVPPVEGVAEGNVALRLATDAKFRGEDFPRGATISVPTTALTLTQPEGAPSVDLAAVEGQREGQPAPTA